jgi:hypothetical protein
MTLLAPLGVHLHQDPSEAWSSRESNVLALSPARRSLFWVRDVYQDVIVNAFIADDAAPFIPKLDCPPTFFASAETN